MGGGGVEVGVSCPVLITSSSLGGSAPSSELLPVLHQGEGSPWGGLSLISKGAVELAPPSPGYYSCLFVVWKATGSWRPVIDLLRLNPFVQPTRFRMETNQSVLYTVRRNDWMFSIDLKDAYLRVPIYPNSRRYLRFVADGQAYQFKALCFGLSTAPQVFTRIMAPVSVILHNMGVRILRYVDDWLASSRVEALWARDKVLDICRQLGIVVNHAKSHLIPSRSSTYLGMYLKSPSLEAFPSQERVLTLRSQIDEFLCCRQQGVVAWHSLLGWLSSPLFAFSFFGGVGPLDALPSVCTAALLGLCRRIRSGPLDSQGRTGPLVVVRHRPPPSGCLL